MKNHREDGLSPIRAARLGAIAAAALTLALALAAVAAGPGRPPPQSPAAESPAEPPPASRLDPRLFPLPPELEDAVDFWTRVYSVHDDDTALLHDELYLGVVYEAIDFGDLEAAELSDQRRWELRERRVRERMNRYRTLLDHLVAGRAPTADAAELERLEELFAAVPGGRGKYRAAKSRMRTQTCLKNRFAEAVERSGVYLPEMERIFARHGLPLELTRLPFVESLFQWNARSSARAGGIWQFVPSTARLYLEMELEYDERFAPLKATEAAARLLAANHRSLGTWPLAITAYNHGAAGMRRAVRRLGTRELGSIVTEYRSRAFGFASRNFYAEFLAAAAVYADREVHFPGTSPRPPLAYEEFVPGLYVAIRDLAQGAGTDLATLREMNPALSSEVWDGHLFLPEGYPLLVPAGRGDDFRRAAGELPESRRSAHQVGLRYRVRRGDTLGKIAYRFGTSVAALQRANKLSSPHRIGVGQRLLIPQRGGPHPTSATPSTATPAPRTATSHVVRRGDTLWSIATRYGTSVAALKSANRLRDDRIYVGQRLTLPGGGGALRATHVVRSGETLEAIARRYGTTVRAIQQANRIRNHIIRPKQVLVIP